MARNGKEITEAMAAIIEETGRPPSEVGAVVTELFSLAKRANRYNEINCNGELTERQDALSAKVDTRMTELAASLGLESELNGDPRGFPFYVKLPKTGRSNSWGGSERGWGIGLS